MNKYCSNRVLLSLLALWALCIFAAILTHWKLFRYLSIAILSMAIIALSISIVYSLLGSPADKSETKNKESK